MARDAVTGRAAAVVPRRLGNRARAAFILPHIERQNHFDQFDFTRGMRDPVNEPAVTTPVPTYLCPSDPQSTGPVLEGRGNLA